MALYNRLLDTDEDRQRSCDSGGSSVVKNISYNLDQQELSLTMPNGKVYTYIGVSRQRYQALCAAGSKGKYFNAAIKNNYGWVRKI